MASQGSLVSSAAPRQTAQVRFADGKTFEGPVGAPLAAFVDAAYPDAPYAIVAAVVDGELAELSLPITRDVFVTPLDIFTNVGMRIYQRSMTFLLVVAVHELFPEARVIVDHSIGFGGLFCQIEGRALFTQEELEAIEARMRAIVEADEPILKECIPVEQVSRLFAEQGYEDKVRLLAYHQEDAITIYNLRGVRDHFYGMMMPSTGKMRWFGLRLYPPGLVLRLPLRQQPNILAPFRDYPKLTAIFREYGHWLNILGMEDVSSLNQVVDSGHVRTAILVAEALHEKHISNIADDLMRRDRHVRLVLIAGPSASGKTTFARRLAIQIRVNGLQPFALGLDDYFVEREQTPRDESGAYDFEALEAINLALFNEHLLALMAGESVRLPHYDFKKGRSELGEAVCLPADTIIIVEGIHGLNPRLVASLPPESVYRIYISALTQLNIDHHNRVPTTDTRLLRRIVRDAQYRGYSAQDTIERWGSVRKGEERDIFPYQENADAMFNSALVYELAVLKPFAEPLLLRVPQEAIESTEARRLLAFLQWVRPCKPDLVPDNSLLREFVGGSILEDFSF